MRFERLELRRYGAFEQRTLDFDPRARIHVVHGPNGAGKSTTLRALRSALFGITAGERTDFRYASATRRIGARLSRADGVTLEFLRRYSPKSPLWSMDDTEPLDASALGPFLGGYDRDTYTRLFGLDQEALRTGGADLVEQRAELGQALFSAALGAERLAEVRGALADERSALFTPGTRSKARLGELGRQHAELKRRRRDAEFTQGRLRKERKELGSLEARIEELDAQRAAASKRTRRLTALRDAARQIARLVELDAKRAELGDSAPALAPDVAERVRGLDAKRRELLAAVEESKRAEDERRADAAEARTRSLESQAAAASDTAATGAAATGTAAAGTAACGTSVDGPGDVSPSDVEGSRAALDRLSEDWNQRAAQRDRASRELEVARAAHARAIEDRDAFGDRADIEFADGLEGLAPFRGGLAALRALAVPRPSVLTDLVEREAASKRGLDEAAARAQESRAAHAAAQARTAAAREAAGGDVPSAADLRAARAARDSALEGVLGAGTIDAAEALRLGRLVADADEIVDRRSAAGSAEADLRAAEREESALRAAMGEDAAAADDCAQALDALRSETEELSGALGIAVQSAADLAAWCEERTALLAGVQEREQELEDEVRSLRDRQEAAEVEFGVAERALAGVQQELGAWASAQGLDAAQGLASLRKTLEERAERSARARADAKALAEIERRLEAARSRRALQEEQVSGRQAALDEHAAEYAGGDVAELLARAKRSDAARALEQERASILQLLAESFAGESVETIREEIGDRSAAELGDEAALAQADLDAVDEERSGARERLGHARRGIEGGGDDAAVVDAEIAQVEAELERAAERYAVLHLAEHLLEREIQAYRGTSQAPLLARAQELFAALTGGAFASLQTDEEGGKDVLKARRPSGELVPVGERGMSEGTADQLYLALRIATVEQSIRGAEPMPFLADDLFTTFDDDRTRAGLEVLAELGASTQVILFTHHRPVVESARSLGLGDGLEVIELESEATREGVSSSG